MYRSINGEIWLDSKFRKLSANAKLLFIYTFGSHHTNVAGLYFMPTEYILVDVGMPIPDAEFALQELIDNKLVARDGEWIYVFGMVKHQSHSPKISEAIRKAFASCESESLKLEFLKRNENQRWDWLKKESEGIQIGSCDTLSLSDTDTATATELDTATELPLKPIDKYSVSSTPEKNGSEKSPTLKTMTPETGARSDPVEEKKKQKTEENPQDSELADDMLAAIRTVASSAKMGSDWIKDIRLMRERDGHSHDEIRQMFFWAHHDVSTGSGDWRGWRYNILSPGKLRKKWVDLEAQRNRPPPPPRRPDRHDEKAWHALAKEHGLRDGYAEDWTSYQRRIWDAVMDKHRNGAGLAS